MDMPNDPYVMDLVSDEGYLQQLGADKTLRVQMPHDPPNEDPVVSLDGERLAVTRVTENTWRVRIPVSSGVTIDYEIACVDQ